MRTITNPAENSAIDSSIIRDELQTLETEVADTSSGHEHDGTDSKSIAATSLPNGIDAAKIGAGGVSNTEFGYLASTGSAVLGQSDTGTFTNKTLTTPVIASLYQDAGKTKLLTMPAASDTLVGKATTDTLTNKILSDDTCSFGDSADVTKKLEVELAGATTAKTMTITSSHTADRALTLPDATDTLIGKATTDTLTNKTFNANGTGNSISNIETADFATNVVDTDGTLTSNSDTRLASQKAIKTYADTMLTKATFDANSIIKADTDNTPAALTVGEGTVIGRASGGSIAALSIDTDLSSVSASDDTIPSAKATKAMGDLKLPLAGGALTGAVTATVDDTDNYVALAITQNDTTNNPNGLNITNAGTGNGLLIDQNGNGSGLYIDKDCTVNDARTWALKIDSDNAGTGTALGCGIDMSSFSVDEPLVKATADAITTAGTISHQIPIDIGGTTYYLIAYTHGS